MKGVVGAFAKDDRVLGWDVWNEPDNRGLDTMKDEPAKVAQSGGVVAEGVCSGRGRCIQRSR